jgi:S-DNA-T family DNA segregation ATPase FtsK/SpoIIIE
LYTNFVYKYAILKKTGREVKLANYIVSVYFQDGIEEIFLPNIDNAVINFTISPAISSFRHDLQLIFEVWNSGWSLRSTDFLELYADSRRVEIAPLRKDVVIMGRIKNTEDKFSIIVNENFDSYTMFNKYTFDRNVSIGANPKNNVQFNVNNLVSGEHAHLAKEAGGKCILADLGSRNGTFINGQRIKRQVELSYGDVIYIVGLKIVYLNDMLAISIPYENI